MQQTIPLVVAVFFLCAAGLPAQPKSAEQRAKEYRAAVSPYVGRWQVGGPDGFTLEFKADGSVVSSTAPKESGRYKPSRNGVLVRWGTNGRATFALAPGGAATYTEAVPRRAAKAAVRLDEDGKPVVTPALKK